MKSIISLEVRRFCIPVLIPLLEPLKARPHVLLTLDPIQQRRSLLPYLPLLLRPVIALLLREVLPVLALAVLDVDPVRLLLLF